MKRKIKILSFFTWMVGLAFLGVSLCIGLHYFMNRSSFGEWKSVQGEGTIDGQSYGVDTESLTKDNTEIDKEDDKLSENQILDEGDVLVDEATFPDSTFREWIKINYKTENGVLKASEIKNIKEMDLSDTNITNLTGINSFVALEKLVCSYESLDTFDVRRFYGVITAILGCPWMEVNNEKIIDYSSLPDWDTKITDGNVCYYLKDGTKKAYPLTGSSIVYPSDAKYIPDCYYQYTETKRIKVCFRMLSEGNHKVPDVLYSSAIQNIGWTHNCAGGMLSGTMGESKRLEALKIQIIGNNNLGIKYSVHCEGKGWLPEVGDGAVAGTEGESRRLEAVKMSLTGSDSEKYDINYRVFLQNYGWLKWAKNGEQTGSIGMSKRIEAIQIVLTEKGKNVIDRYGKPWTEEIFMEQAISEAAQIDEKKEERRLSEATVCEAFEKRYEYFFRKDIGVASSFVCYDNGSLINAFGRSYTGSAYGFNVDPISGEAVCYEVIVPGLNLTEEQEEEEMRNMSFNAWDYLD